MNPSVNMDILASLKLGQEPKETVELLLGPGRRPGELVLEISVEQQPDLVPGDTIEYLAI